MSTSLKDLLLTRRIICTVGSGGVGKTTCAAALGLAAAVLGRRTLVLTIDPARRLASAMGLDVMGAEAHVLETTALAALGVPAAQPVSVKMLHLKAAWDDMVRRLSPGTAKVDEILANRFYGYLSTELAGAQEYIACEQLYELASAGRYDLVILDTPPTANALDFLEAPDRILGILNHDVVRVAARPAMAARRFSAKIFDLAGTTALAALEKVTGGEVLRELGEFLVMFEGLFDPLRARAEAVRTLLASDDTAFVLVASPEGGPLAQARFFLDELERMKLKVGSIVVNRVRVVPDASPGMEALVGALVSQGLPADHAQVQADLAMRALADAQLVAARERDIVEPLRRAARGAPILRVPRLGDDVHDIPGLWKLSQQLLSPLPELPA